MVVAGGEVTADVVDFFEQLLPKASVLEVILSGQQPYLLSPQLFFGSSTVDVEVVI